MKSVAALGRVDKLKQKGFQYDFDRYLFINRDNKKIFSLEALEDIPDLEFDKCLKENNEDWAFYFNEKPSVYVKEVLISEFS